MMFPCSIIPVLVIENSANAQALGESLVQHHLPVAEVTLRTASALESINTMSKIDKLITGAGTVLNVDHAKAAIDAGASFLVSPGLNEAVIQYAQSVDVPIIPGVVTPTEVGRAIELGVDTVKLFPAEAVGGAKLLKAYSAVYPELQFMPTGGITPDNVGDYLSLPNVMACGGSWMVPGDLLESGDFEAIGKLIDSAAKLSAIYTK